MFMIGGGFGGMNDRMLPQSPMQNKMYRLPVGFENPINYAGGSSSFDESAEPFVMDGGMTGGVMRPAVEEPAVEEPAVGAPQKMRPPPQDMMNSAVMPPGSIQQFDPRQGMMGGGYGNFNPFMGGYGQQMSPFMGMGIGSMGMMGGFNPFMGGYGQQMSPFMGMGGFGGYGQQMSPFMGNMNGYGQQMSPFMGGIGGFSPFMGNMGMGMGGFGGYGNFGGFGQQVSTPFMGYNQQPQQQPMPPKQEMSWGGSSQAQYPVPAQPYNSKFDGPQQTTMAASPFRMGSAMSPQQQSAGLGAPAASPAGQSAGLI